jgi:TPR repeat protein
MRYLCLPILVLALLAGPGMPRADDLSDGIAAYDAKEDGRAYDLLLPYADKGHPESCFRIGVILENGTGRKAEPKRAAKYYEIAAKAGLLSATFNLGRLYDIGLGVPQDYAKAAEYYRIGAEKHYASSQMNLGLLFMGGRGLPTDFVRGLMWLKLAEANGVENGSKAIAYFSKHVTDRQKELAEEARREWVRAHPR